MDRNYCPLSPKDIERFKNLGYALYDSREGRYVFKNVRHPSAEIIFDLKNRTAYKRDGFLGKESLFYFSEYEQKLIVELFHNRGISNYERTESFLKSPDLSPYEAVFEQTRNLQITLDEVIHEFTLSYL